MKKGIAYLYAFLCILFWGLIPTISKIMLRELDNLQILFYSSVFSVITLFSIIIYQKKIRMVVGYPVKDYLRMAFLGLLGSYLYYVLLYGAFSLTTASEGYILAYTWPIIAVLLGVFLLRERVTFTKLFAMLLSFLGVAIVFTRGNISGFSFTSLSGNMLAVIAASLFALFSVAGKKFNFDKTVSVFIFWTVSLVCTALTILWVSSFKLFSFSTLLFIMLNGVIINGVTYIFWFKALELGDTAKVSNILYLSPIMALVYISIFLHEKILISSMIGFGIIFIGIIIQLMQRETRRKK